MSKKNKIIFLIIIAVVVLALFGFFIYDFSKNLENNENSQGLNNDVKQENVLVIDDGEGRPKIFNIEYKEGITAFDLLKTKTAESGLILKTKQNNAGVFIESIAGIKNGDAGKQWLYYVNGKMLDVASDKKQLKAGDKVEFKFEKSPF